MWVKHDQNCLHISPFFMKQIAENLEPICLTNEQNKTYTAKRNNIPPDSKVFAMTEICRGIRVQ